MFEKKPRREFSVELADAVRGLGAADFARLIGRLKIRVTPGGRAQGGDSLREITAKFEGYCRTCGKRIAQGQICLYDPMAKLALHIGCRVEYERQKRIRRAQLTDL